MADLLKASYKDWLAEVHGFDEIAAADQVLLLDLFVAAGRPLSARPTDGENSPAWVQYWSDIAQDAGLKGNMACNGWIRWLAFVPGSSESPDTGGTRSSTMVAVLQKHGITVDSKLRTDISTELGSFELGNEHVQATCLRAKCVFYMLESPGDDDKEWMDRQMTSINGDLMAQKFGQSQLATIDVTKMPSYDYRLRKSKRGLLEHALLEKTGYAWSKYRSEMLRMLNSVGLSLAANRFNNIQARLEKLELHNPLRQRQFWFELFYTEWRGLGLPRDWCEFAYQSVCSQDPSTMARIKLEHVPTLAPSPAEAMAAAAGSQNDALMLQLAQMQMTQIGLGAPGQVGQMEALRQLQLNQLPMGFAAPAAGVGTFGSLPAGQPWPQSRLPGAQGNLGEQGGAARIQEVVCAYCKSTNHETDQCSEMQRAGKAHRDARDAKNHQAAVARRAAQAARNAAAEE